MELVAAEESEADARTGRVVGDPFGEGRRHDPRALDGDYLVVERQTRSPGRRVGDDAEHGGPIGVEREAGPGPRAPAPYGVALAAWLGFFVPFRARVHLQADPAEQPGQRQLVLAADVAIEEAIHPTAGRRSRSRPHVGLPDRAFVPAEPI